MPAELPYIPKPSPYGEKVLVCVVAVGEWIAVETNFNQEDFVCLEHHVTDCIQEAEFCEH